MAAAAAPVSSPWQAWDSALDSHKALLQVRGPWAEITNPGNSSELLSGCEGTMGPGCRSACVAQQQRSLHARPMTASIHSSTLLSILLPFLSAPG